MRRYLPVIACLLLLVPVLCFSLCLDRSEHACCHPDEVCVATAPQVQADQPVIAAVVLPELPSGVFGFPVPAHPAELNSIRLVSGPVPSTLPRILRL